MQTLLDRSPDELVGTSLQALMGDGSRAQFVRVLDKARAGEQITYTHDILHKSGLAMQAQTRLYPGDAIAGRKPIFLVAQTRLLKTAPRPVAAMTTFQSDLRPMGSTSLYTADESSAQDGLLNPGSSVSSAYSQPSMMEPLIGTQDSSPTPEDNLFDELEPTHCTSWQFELRQMEKNNRLLSEELASLLSNRKKRKRRKSSVNSQRNCANCHTRVTPEWRRGPSGLRDLCNSCGLRWAKQVSRNGSDQSASRFSAKGEAQLESSSSRS